MTCMQPIFDVSEWMCKFGSTWTYDLCCEIGILFRSADPSHKLDNSQKWPNALTPSTKRLTLFLLHCIGIDTISRTGILKYAFTVKLLEQVLIAQWWNRNRTNACHVHTIAATWCPVIDTSLMYENVWRSINMVVVQERRLVTVTCGACVCVSCPSLWLIDLLRINPQLPSSARYFYAHAPAVVSFQTDATGKRKRVSIVLGIVFGAERWMM